jgi:hypothetical protein
VTASSFPRFASLVAAIIAASLITAFGQIADAHAESRVAMAPQPEKKEKCITIGDKRICLEDLKKKSGKPEEKTKTEEKTETKPAPPDAKTPPPPCPLGIDPATGMCRCPAGQVNYGDGTCGKPCGYGMSGKPPNCRCVTGAKLQVTGPLTKACLCLDGKPPEEVDANYACQNLGPQ